MPAPTIEPTTKNGQAKTNDDYQAERDAALVSIENAVRRFLKAGGTADELHAFCKQATELASVRQRVSAAREKAGSK